MNPQNIASPYPPQHGRDYTPAHVHGDIPANYSNESRNYTDSQLGIGGGGGTGHGSMPLLASPPPQAPPPAYRPSPLPLQPQQYSTPRMPRHATVLKDRGNSENSVGSDPSGGSDGYGGRGNVPASLKGNPRAGLHGKHLNKPGKASAKPQPKEMRTPDGRHTPVRDHHLEGQVLFATPNRRQVPSTPTSVYSEPPRSRTGNRAHHQNMSPNYNRMRSPDHHSGNYSKGGGSGGYYNKNQLSKHQSKLPHGLTVQELKEMTRARLAAEAEIGGPEGSSDQSVHSVGTQNSSKGSDPFSLGMSRSALSNESMTRNLVQSNESIRRDYPNQGMNCQSFTQGQQQQMQQMQPPNPPRYNYPRHSSPVFDPGPPPNQFNGGNRRTPRQTSPVFALSQSQTRSQGEAWDTASAASSTPAPDYLDAVFQPGHKAAGPGPLPFSSPMRDSNAMRFNRGRCFSAGAGVPSSFERHQAVYYDHVPLSGGANRERCATCSPPGMSRLHEDRPFPISTGEKERLAIPSLSEPRRRLHSAEAFVAPGDAMRAFGAHLSPPRPTLGSGSAFVPIGKANEQFLPKSPRSLCVDRTKFNVADRTMSSGSAGHGDLPSSMAEAVLESITSTSGAPIGGELIDSSPFRSTEQELAGASPFRGMSKESSGNTLSAFRLDTLLTESSGSMSLFSNKESRNLFSTGNTGGRMLLGTHSWGGAENDAAHSNMGINHDFSNLLNLPSGNGTTLPPLRGRAATEPNWFGGGNDDPRLVSRIDPEHNGDCEEPPCAHAPNSHQGSSFDGLFR